MLAAISSNAIAEETPQTTAFAAESLAKGHGVTKLKNLVRSTALTAKSAETELRVALCGSTCAPKSSVSSVDGLRSTGDGFEINVFGDGSAGEYTDVRVRDSKLSLAVEEGKKLSNQELETIGRALLAGKLRNIARLEKNETLYSAFIAHQREGSFDLSTGKTVSRVIGSRIVFKRQINGIPVFGSGSSIALSFANNGSLESVYYDWPKYSESDEQSLVARATVLQKIQDSAYKRAGRPVPTSAPSPSASKYPVELALDTTLQTLECGYFDAGLRVRDGSAPVQPGCVYHIVQKQTILGRTIENAFAGAVPTSTTPTADPTWQETLTTASQSLTVEGEPSTASGR
jgi:hypothetical protein